MKLALAFLAPLATPARSACQTNADGTLVKPNTPESAWDVSCVTSFKQLFLNKKDFNADISDWDVSKATSMEWMFVQAAAFNADLSKWDVSKVTNMENMFAYSAFNGDLSAWDVRAVTNMAGIFYLASAFTGPVDWCILDTVDVRRLTTNSACGSTDKCGFTIVSDLKDCSGDVSTDGSDDAAGCADDPDWHKDGDSDYTCKSVEAANEKKKWKKKKAKKNCKAVGADGEKASKACHCSACDTSRFKKKKKKAKHSSVVIAVPVRFRRLFF